MNKAKTGYSCQECGMSYNKWAGKCDSCGSWNTIVAEAHPIKPLIHPSADKRIEIHNLADCLKQMARTTSGIAELDRALGGGIVPGSAILIGGEPGIGKSTLLLQVTAQAAHLGNRCFYISGEESAQQIKLRAHRLNLQQYPVQVVCCVNLNEMMDLIQQHTPHIVVIDSIQTLYNDEISAAPGTVSQVKSCAFSLITLCKQLDICLILVGHITKEGQIAGPKVLEHMVDAVLYFEGERGNSFRIIRAVKNRFGAANEIGVFEMQDNGLAEVTNPSALFLSQHTNAMSGVAVFAAVEGTRTILVEVQALIVPTFMAAPRRSALGWDGNRLATLIAVLNVRYGINLLDKEVYMNFAGGIRIDEPAADLAVIASLISAISDVPISKDTVFFGEVGLSGEVRQVTHHALRLNEAAKLNFKMAVCPSTKKSSCNIKQTHITEISELKKIIR